MTPKLVKNLVDTTTFMSRNGEWLPARPHSSLIGIKMRLKAAWDILTLKADPLYWPDGEGGWQKPL